jgi:trimeric autotransporter adhesin
LSDLSEALNKTTRPILAGKINSSSSLVNELANITSSLKPTITAAAAATASDKNNNTNGKNSKTNQDIDKIKSIIKLEEKFKKNIDLFQKEINSCQHLEAISMEFISNENSGQKQQQQQPSSSTKITKTKTSTNNSTKTTTTTTTTITKNSSVIDSKTTTVSNSKNIKGANEKVIQLDESSSSGKKLRSSSSSSSSMANVINNAKISTTSSPVKILKELAKSKDKKYSEVKRMIEDEKLAKELAIKLREQDSDDYEDDDEDDCEHESDEEDEDSDEEEEDEEDSDDDDDDEDDDGEYSQEFQNMSYNDHLITIIMKPPKGSGNQSNTIQRNALKGKAINVATAAATSSSAKVSSLTSSVKCKDRDKVISLTANEEERIESTLSALSLHGHLTNRKPSVEEILKTINSNDENIIFVQPFSENNGNVSKSTDTTTTTTTTASTNVNQQQRKTYRRKPVMQCTNVHCISSGNGNCHANSSTSGVGATTTTTTTTSTTTSRNKDVLIESNTVIRLNASPTRSGIVDLRDEKNASQLAFLLNLKNESQKSSSVYNRLKAQAAKPLQKLNSNSSETSNKNSAKMTGTIMKSKSFFFAHGFLNGKK